MRLRIPLGALNIQLVLVLLIETTARGCGPAYSQRTLSNPAAQPAPAPPRALPTIHGRIGGWPLLPAASARTFGETALHVPDADGDGIDDILVAEPSDVMHWPLGKAFLLSGRTGLPLGCWIQAAQPSQPMQGLGSVTWFGGDVDGDAADDVVLSEPNLGKVWIISGKRALTLHELQLQPGFCALTLASSSSAAGAQADRLLAAHPGSPGKLEAFSLTGERIQSIDLPVIDSMTACMSVGPDVTGDGIDDIAISGTELTATLVSGANLERVRDLQAPAGQAPPAQVRLAESNAKDPRLMWLFPQSGAAIWTLMNSNEKLAEEHLEPWHIEDGTQPRARALEPSQQSAFLAAAAQAMSSKGAPQPLPARSIWAAPSGTVWGAGETEIWRGYVGASNHPNAPADPVIVDPFQCRMLDLPQAAASNGSSASSEIVSRLRALVTLLREGQLAALGKVADPELGLRLWTTSGSVAQPTHKIDSHGKVTPPKDSRETHEYLVQTWLPTVAKLVEFGLEHLRIDEPMILDPRVPSAVLRTHGYARSELANEFRSKTAEKTAATAILAQPIEVQFAVANYNTLRVYLSTRKDAWYIAQIILNESEADPEPGE